MTVCEQAEVKLKYKFHNGTKTKMILHNLYCKLFHHPSEITPAHDSLYYHACLLFTLAKASLP